MSLRPPHALLAASVFALVLAAAPPRAIASPPVLPHWECWVPDSEVAGEWTLAAFLDSRHDRLVALRRDMSRAGTPIRVWTLDLVPGSRWSLAGVDPAPFMWSAAISDTSRDRVLFYAGSGPVDFEGAVYPSAVVALSLAEPMHWELIPVEGEFPPLRLYSGVAFDTRRNHLLISGGDYYTAEDGFIVRQDLWSLQLVEPRTWSELVPDAAPDWRYGFELIYDSTRDRLLQQKLPRAWGTLDVVDPATGAVDSIRPLNPLIPWRLAGVFDPGLDLLISWRIVGYEALRPIEWLRFDPAPWWSLPGVDAGPPPPNRSHPFLIDDPGRSRVWVVSGSIPNWFGDYHSTVGVWALRFDPAEAPIVECPRPANGTLDPIQSQTYAAGNPHPYAYVYSWRLTDTNGWPGLPLTGQVSVPANSVVPVTVPVPVPFTGTWVDTLKFSLLDLGGTTVFHTCVQVFKPSQEPRLGVPTDRGRIVSGLDVRPNPARTRVEVRFALGWPQSATLELLDIAGRVVERRALGVVAAGWHDETFELRAPRRAGRVPGAAAGGRRRARGAARGGPMSAQAGRNEPGFSLTPMVTMLFVASLAALAAAVVVLTVAQRVASRVPSIASAPVDSLSREVDSLRRQLALAQSADRPVDAIGPFEIDALKERGLANPIADLKADLAKHRELIPYEGVLGGTMGFYSDADVHVLNDRWVFARFEDGHVGGFALLEYAVKDGHVTWKRVKVARDE